MTVVAFTGHRPQKVGGFDIPNPQQQYIIAELRKALEKIQPERVISGMALGVDQWAAQLCVDMEIPFIAAISCEGQERVWRPEQQKYYNELLAKACRIVNVTPGGYAGWKMIARNSWMVDNCDLLIAVWDGSDGGTGHCVGDAKKKGREIIQIHPGRFFHESPVS